MSSIFTKIIQGDLPCYKIYEDDKTFAFLDIAPEGKGHTLVVPKIEVQRVYDLPDDYYFAVMMTVRRLAQHYAKILGEPMMLKVVGIDVDHAHVHILPASTELTKEEYPKPTEAEFLALQEQLKLD